MLNDLWCGDKRGGGEELQGLENSTRTCSCGRPKKTPVRMALQTTTQWHDSGVTFHAGRFGPLKNLSHFWNINNHSGMTINNSSVQTSHQITVWHYEIKPRKCQECAFSSPLPYPGHCPWPFMRVFKKLSHKLGTPSFGIMSELSQCHTCES